MDTELMDGPVPFQLIAESTYDWESWLSTDGRLLWVNRAVERLTEHSIEEALAEPDYPMCWVLEEDCAYVRAAHDDAQKGGSGNDLEFRLWTKSRSIRWFAMSYQPMLAEDGSVLGFRTSVRDIHERKDAEEKLLEAMKLAGHEAKAKKDFLASMSHELRTPLQCIMGYGELALDVVEEERAQRYLKTICNQSEDLLRMISNILELASSKEAGTPSESSELRFVEVQLRDELEGLFDLVRPLARSRELFLSLEVASDVPPRLLVDLERLRRIVLNLVGNSIKFTPSGEIAMRVELLPSNGERLRLQLEIRDTGSGIREEFLSRLFEPFSQAEGGASRRFGGSGLGLYISRRLALELGGTLELKSTSTKGTSFVLTFTAKVPEGSPTRASRFAAVGGQSLSGEEAPTLPPPLSIVVIDDSRIVLELIGELLQRLGSSPQLFHDGAAALAYIEETETDLVLIDLHMPVHSGAAFAREIRRMNLKRQPHLVAMSADPFARGVTRQEGGALDEFWPKPIGLERLRGILGRAFAKRTTPELPSELIIDERVLQDLLSLGGGESGSMLARVLPKIEVDTKELLRKLSVEIREKRQVASDEERRLRHALKGNCVVLGITSAARLCDRRDVELSALEEHLRRAFLALRHRL